MMKTKEYYDFKAIEEKWQKQWAESDVFKATEDPARKKHYVLEMFIYPSGKVHIGHLRNYSLGDAYARFKRMQGFNVLHPFGYDAFGLPAENAAIKHKTHPEKWTMDNIAQIRAQLKRLGISYDWTREITTCLPDYYKWNQWFFLKMYERGLAYRKFGWVNWCPDCNTVLANEQVVGGYCWRHQETPVEQKELEQWFFKITAYAEELLQATYELPAWPEKVLLMQRNWIGKSEGAMVNFPVVGTDQPIMVFTTRIDTIYGANSVLLSPEHPLVEELVKGSERQAEIMDFVQRMRNKLRSARLLVDLEKEGMFTGRYARNPFSGEQLPIWIANFVLMDYGTGAIMSVPAHDQRDFEFAKKYHLPIPVVIQPRDREIRSQDLTEASPEYGRLVNSGPFTGLSSEDALAKMAQYAEKHGFGKATITYRLKDWCLSRQRFWGTLIPIIYCERCGVVPVPYEQLPVVLPKIEDFTPSGGSPVSKAEDFVKTTCPKCQGPARRETDTMDTFVDSSWYFFRYTDPHNDALPFRPERAKYWFPIDFYIGGIEHATLHLIYMRFFTKVIRDLGMIDFSEPVIWLFTQGMVTMGGAAMSKSLGNVVDPDVMVEKFGVDTVRTFILFAAPPERDLEWSDTGIEGAHRFLNRVYRLVAQYADLIRDLKYSEPEITSLDEAEKQLQRRIHQTIRRVTLDIDGRLHLNTAIARIMELVNELYHFTARDAMPDTSLRLLKSGLENLVLLLSPFAPHLCEELWERLGKPDGITFVNWPRYDPELAREEQLEIVVQVNGKLADRLFVDTTTDDETIKSQALASPKVRSRIEGKKIGKTVYVPKKLVNIVIT
jgi:leucyl-tRNA synthetase